MNLSLAYRKYSTIIKQHYYAKRIEETPFLRDIEVFYHVGESGSGKSYQALKIVEEQGENSIYMYMDYENGGRDNYNGEPILFMDEFRGQMKYSALLGMLQGYRAEVHARYANPMPLWSEVHITSVLPPEKLYQNMVQENRSLDSIEQLLRRINYVVYHQKAGGEYHQTKIPMSEYTDYDTLKRSYHIYPDWVKECEQAIEDGRVEEMPLPF
jgi:ABC-type dipeptide/oligopeptide/nickel transport system ATPase component